MNKHEYYDRFRFILSDPLNNKIIRNENSGKIIDGYLIMYNGLKVIPNSYYDNFSDILLLNNGVHEPQEEYVFNEIISNLNFENPIMVELGAYWAFYSMSFLQKNKSGVSFLVEPDSEYIKIGKNHFEINGMTGNFIQDFVSNNNFKIDSFVKKNLLSKINIVHCDIQGYEYEMLLGSLECIKNKIIDYFFISTHSQNLHNICSEFLNSNGYKIIGSADFDNQTFCHDGVLIATSIPNHKTFNLGDKSKIELISEKYLNEIITEKLNK